MNPALDKILQLPGALKKLTLQPLTPRHLALLRKIDSPVLLAAKILMAGTEACAEEIAKLQSQNVADETRETVFVLVTPFGRLNRIERLSREELRATAFETVPAYKEDELARIQQMIGVYIGSRLLSLAKKHRNN